MSKSQRCFDRWGGIITAIAAVVSAFAAWGGVYFAYTMSPNYEGARPQVAYFYERENDGKAKDGLFNGHLKITINNVSRHPAKGVKVTVDPLCAKAVIKCPGHEHQTFDGSNGRKVVVIETISVNGNAIVEVQSPLPELPPDKNPFVYERWKDAPFVESVETDFGRGICLFDQCHSRVTVSAYGFDEYL